MPSGSLAESEPAALVASALAAVGLVTTGVLATLPVLTVPAVLIGPPPAHQLQLGLLVSLVVAVVVAGVLVGPGWHSLIVALGGGGGMIVAGLISWLRLR